MRTLIVTVAVTVVWVAAVVLVELAEDVADRRHLR